jgi:ribosomal-protein-alanine N-acetyltransferase
MGHSLLVTRRLTLRRPIPADVPTIFAVHADPEASRHNPSDALVTVAEARGLFARWDAQWERYGYGYWVVTESANGVVGFCGLKPMPLRSFGGREVLNLFYRFAPSAWGHGFATEAASRVVAWARDHCPEWTVVARVRPANLASQRVALNAGLHRTPHLDDVGEDGPDWLYATRAKLE